MTIRFCFRSLSRTFVLADDVEPTQQLPPLSLPQLVRDDVVLPLQHPWRRVLPLVNISEPTQPFGCSLRQALLLRCSNGSSLLGLSRDVLQPWQCILLHPCDAVPVLPLLGSTLLCAAFHAKSGCPLLGLRDSYQICLGRMGLTLNPNLNVSSAVVHCTCAFLFLTLFSVTHLILYLQNTRKSSVLLRRQKHGGFPTC